MKMRRNRSLYLALVLCPALCLYVLFMLKKQEGDWSDETPFIKTYEDARVKKIVFWTSAFGNEKWGTSPGERRSVLHCAVNVTCQLYSAKTHPLHYDALVFHGRDPQRPPSERSPNQAYIMFLHESPVYGGDFFIPGDTFYNWTMTHARTSDFVSPYFYTIKLDEDSIKGHHVNDKTIGRSASLTMHGSFYNMSSLKTTMHHDRLTGEAMVFWVVSHCNTSSQREQYVDALKQHLVVDIFGKCGQDCETNEEQSGLRCHEFLVKTGKYKFYLALENSVCRDYITEKVTVALQHGLVPIVYGGLSTEDYTAILPPASFLDVRNFTSPKHLAEYLVYLDKNDKAYLAYHAWRAKWEIRGESGQAWCDVCHALHNIKNIPPKNVDWGKFWDPVTECDNHLLEKVLGKNIKSS